MKTTIDIADPLLAAAKKKATEEHRTLRDVVEEGLRHLLAEEPRKPFQLRYVPPMKGQGLTPEFQNAPWEKIRDEIYEPY
jgi:hypothetical protein